MNIRFPYAAKTLLIVLTCSVLFVLTSRSASAQKKYTISGTVKDASTGEVLIGATFIIKQSAQNGTASNSYGFYSISAPAGKDTLLVTYVGYSPAAFGVDMHGNKTINVSLSSKSDLTEVVINGRARNNENVTSPQMGVEKLDMSQINNVPVLLGERDILKTISLLPGVKAASEGNTGFYVRGGASDQNLILLDEAVVYNASHLFGFFSTFNSDAIKDVSLYKGGMPAQYGGRLSSVLDIKMDEGNNQDYVVQGGLGLISSRLKIEGPIVKNKGSFMIIMPKPIIILMIRMYCTCRVILARMYWDCKIPLVPIGEMLQAHCDLIIFSIAGCSPIPLLFTVIIIML